MAPGRPVTKATKKRKVGNADPSQHKLDRFLSPGSPFQQSSSQQSSSSQPVKEEPMQIDSVSSSVQEVSQRPVTVNASNLLGTFRQQSLIPCIAIANAQPARSKTLPDSFFNTSWETQRTLIVGILCNTTTHSINFVTASKLCESLCRYGKAQDIYDKLKKEIEDHVVNMKKELFSTPVNVDLLLRLNNSWTTFCNQLSVIRNVFMELDRSFILPNTKFSSIIQLGKHVFSDTIMESNEFRAIIVAEVLKMIKLDRDKEPVDIKLIQSTLQMMIELSFYAIDFEPRFLSNTRKYYEAESNTLIHQLSIPQYIEHANTRRSEESNDRIQNYLDIHTKQSLINVVTEELIYSKAHIIIKKGFEDMVESMLVKPLGIFYELLSPNPRISLLRSAFGDYIKEKGVALIKNPEKDQDMIMNLIDFKRKLDHVLQQCFDNDTSFQNALKESFEYLINTRGNKPAELLAKFIDSKLKPVPKRSPKPDGDLELLDNALVLFRYIQGKDAFEAYYKRFLAKRLLMDRSSSRENEGRVIENLKLECGHEFTKNLESMFQDIKLSIDLNTDFKEFERNTPRMPISVKVIQQSIWPASPASDILLPPSMLKSQQAFERFYVARHKGKKLLWQNSLSACNLTAHYSKGTKELVMTLYQAAILLLFNENATLSVRDMMTSLNLDEKELKKLLSTLTTCKLLLVNGQNYTYNSEFTSVGPKFKVPKVALDQAVEESKNVEEKLFHNRQHQVDAAVVRIMKEKKTCSHVDLVTELLKQLTFPVEASDIKKRIESLIDKDYLARDTENPSIYVYQS